MTYGVCLVTQLCLTLWDPMVAPPASSAHAIFQARIQEWDPANPGIEPRSPTLQADSLPSEPLHAWCCECRI